ncbi:hypothetical protein [Solibacillus sp. FSL H8-0538]|uniref:hypothetical protein n=1 Tax=Solibacillus sp. FSL H8-0538 TaxID=2921400 RepID=UPI0030F9DF5D
MNNRNKLLTYVLSSVLSIGLIGSAAVSTFAITVYKDIHIVEDYEKLDAKTQEKVDDIFTNLKSELAKLGVTPHNGKDEIFANLDEEAKEKAHEIMHKMKDGTLSHEEAAAELAKLGVELPKHPDKYENLDKKTKAKVHEIMQQVKKGALTKEEADKKLTKLGVELPKHQGKGEKFANLDDTTKAQVKILIEEAKADLDELGVEVSDKYLKHFEYLTK